MSWLETLRTGLGAVLSHRLRSGLTMLGILIGIAAVILTVGFGEGAQGQVSSEINDLGSNLLVVSPGSSTATTGIRGGVGSASPLTAPGTNWTTTVVGTSPDWLSVRARSVTEGRFLTQADENTDAAVAVLGATTAEELFGLRDPVGQTVTVNGLPLTVIGVLNTVGASASSSTTNLDDQAVVPITTVANRIFGGSTRTSVQSIYIEATSSNALSAAYQEATAELLRLHQVSAADADFTIQSQQSLLTTATSVDKTLTELLAGIAAISLLVGGIGVMNIMLVSVTERVREIGLRKALGATQRAIRRQFLVEASVLGLAGGVLGAGIGLAGAVLLPHLISNPITISPAATVAAIIVAVGIGIVFGVYPPTRAARLAPIDALRGE